VRDPLTLDPDAAWRASAALVAVSRQCAQEGRRLDRVAVAGWSGEASERFYASIGRLRPRLDDVALVASYAATVLADLASELEQCRAVLREADAVRRGVADGTLGEGGLRPALAQESWEAAVHRAARRLDALRDEVPGRPLTVGDHVGEGVRSAWRTGVVEPATVLWGLTGVLVVDPPRWLSNVEAARDGVRATFEEPQQAGRDAIEYDTFAAGEIGSGTGALVGGIMTGGVGAMARQLRAESRADPDFDNLPWPRLQSLWEMLAHVDLSRHEHPQLGHTLTRHVHIDDAGLRRRVFEPGTKRDAASRFTDLATAEEVVTQVLRTHADALQKFASNRSKRLDLTLVLDEPVGVVLPHGRAIFDLPPVPAHRVVVTLNKDAGRVFVRTARLEHT
jgi:hypothetical protein